MVTLARLAFREIKEMFETAQRNTNLLLKNNLEG